MELKTKILIALLAVYTANNVFSQNPVSTKYPSTNGNVMNINETLEIGGALKVVV